jgi:hypothetical protein
MNHDNDPHDNSHDGDGHADDDDNDDQQQQQQAVVEFLQTFSTLSWEPAASSGDDENAILADLADGVALFEALSEMYVCMCARGSYTYIGKWMVCGMCGVWRICVYIK